MDLRNWLNLFAPLFSASVWEAAVVLLFGAILAPGKRTVSAILRTMGLAQHTNYQRYHRVLSPAVWSSRKASGILFHHLIVVFAPVGPIILAIDDTIERRWGKRIAECGIYRCPDIRTTEKISASLS